MAGYGNRSARLGGLAALALILAGAGAFAQTMYKYQDADGNWVFTDRQPPEAQPVETLELPDR